MRQFSSSPKEMFASLWRNRELLKVSIHREVLGRYKGSLMGTLWSFFNPLFMLAIYTFVFSEVFKTRWNNASYSKYEFALVLFAGLIVFNLFAECINRAPSLILTNTNYVKKVLFPLEILPCVVLVSAIFHALISLGVWFLAFIFIYGLPHPTVLYFPLVVMPFFLFVLGLSWALASLGVFIRDISQFMGVITSVFMFLSPIFYPASSLPDNYRYFLYLNPLTTVIEQTRDVLFWGISPNFLILSFYWVGSAIIAWLGFAWFQNTRQAFADVL